MDPTIPNDEYRAYNARRFTTKRFEGIDPLVSMDYDSFNLDVVGIFATLTEGYTDRRSHSSLTAIT